LFAIVTKISPKWEPELDLRGWVGFGEVGIWKGAWVQIQGPGAEKHVKS